MELPIVFPVVLIVGGLVVLALLWRYMELGRVIEQADPFEALATELDQARKRVKRGEKLRQSTAHRIRAALTSLTEASGE